MTTEDIIRELKNVEARYKHVAVPTFAVNMHEMARDCRETIERMDAELQKYRQAEAEGRLVVLPCRVGDKMFSLCWNTKKEKYELYTSEIKNVRYDSHDGSVMVSDGERFRVWGKTGFATREAAETALAKEGGGE